MPVAVLTDVEAALVAEALRAYANQCDDKADQTRSAEMHQHERTASDCRSLAERLWPDGGL